MPMNKFTFFDCKSHYRSSTTGYGVALSVRFLCGRLFYIDHERVSASDNLYLPGRRIMATLLITMSGVCSLLDPIIVLPMVAAVSWVSSIDKKLCVFCELSVFRYGTLFLFLEVNYRAIFMTSTTVWSHK